MREEEANSPAETATSPASTVLPTTSSVAFHNASAATMATSGTIPQTIAKTGKEVFSTPLGSPKVTASPADERAPGSIAPEELDQDGDQVSAQLMTVLDNLIPDRPVRDQEQGSSQSTVIAPAVRDDLGSLGTPTALHHQDAAVAVPLTKAPPVKHSDPAPACTTETHPESMLPTTSPTLSNQPQQHSPSVKDAAKADEHPTASAAHSPLGSDKSSQASPGNSSGHGAKHDDSNTAQPSSAEAKALQQGILSPTPDTRTTFSDAMASKIAGVISPKEPSVTPGPSAPDLQTTEGAHVQASNTDAEHSGQQAAVATPLGTIHSAKLIAQAAQSELRVGFHAGEFGNVDIRTSMSRSQLTAEISVEHGELRNLLAVELPHLQTKLAAHPFTTANIALSSHTGSGSSNSRQAYQQNTQSSQSAGPAPTEQQPATELTALTESQLPITQLDVHM